MLMNVSAHVYFGGGRGTKVQGGQHQPRGNSIIGKSRTKGFENTSNERRKPLAHAK